MCPTKVAKSLSKEVIKMKKLIMIVMAIAMVVAFAPCAGAAESAQLGLQVTFAIDNDLRQIELIKNRIDEVEVYCEKVFRFVYVDRNNDGVVDYKDLDFNVDGQIDDSEITMLRERVSILSTEADRLNNDRALLESILARRPDLKDQVLVVIYHIEKIQAACTDYITKLKALEQQPVISIELEGPNPWVLDGVKLGERRSNVTADNVIAHKVHNTGTVTVKVAIAYGSYSGMYGIPRPGLEQGLDTFITLIKDGDVLPPNEGRGVFTIGPTEGAPLNLTYGAPKELSQPVKGMGVNYELKAYPGN